MLDLLIHKQVRAYITIHKINTYKHASNMDKGTKENNGALSTSVCSKYFSFYQSQPNTKEH